MGFLLFSLPGLSSVSLSNPLVKGVLTLVLIAIIVYFLFKVVKKIVLLLANSFLGLVLLVALSFTSLKVPITLWSVLVTLFGGLLGLVAVVVMHLLGISL